MFVERVVGYVDGYNLYFGLLEAKLRTSRWLDLTALCRTLLEPQQVLVGVRYFTARVRNNRGDSTRQATYLDALTARGGVSIDYGHFLSQPARCRSCGATWRRSEEKKTDVNIAVARDDDRDIEEIVEGVLQQSYGDVDVGLLLFAPSPRRTT